MPCLRYPDGVQNNSMSGAPGPDDTSSSSSGENSSGGKSLGSVSRANAITSAIYIAEVSKRNKTQQGEEEYIASEHALAGQIVVHQLADEPEFV